MKLFPRKKKSVVALEIDGNWLKIVQAELAPKERTISRIIVEEISGKEGSRREKISGRIKDLLKGLKIDLDSLIVVVPHQTTAIRNLEFPSANPAEIKNMVELQIGKLTPFAKEEIIYDFQILSTNAEGYSAVMLAIVHQDMVKGYFEILKAAGLKTERVALSSEGLLAWSGFASQDKTGQLCALVNVDYDKSDFAVILKDKVIFCRNISIRHPCDSSANDDWQEKFIKEIKNSLYAYQIEMAGEEINRIVVTGAQMFIASLDETVLKDKLNVPVEIISQLQNIPQAPGSESSEVGSTSVASLLGFALVYPKQRFNFIPLQLRMERDMKERGRDLYQFGIYLAFILMTVSSIFLGRVYNKEKYLAQLKREALKIKDKADKLSNMLEVADAAKKRSLKKVFALNFIYEIHSVVSPEIYLTAINYDGGGEIILRGVSNAMSQVFEFLNALEKSKYFQDVKTKFVTTRNVNGKDLTEFEIVCPLEAGFRQQLTGE